MPNSKAIVMSLTSGVTLMTEVLHETDTSYVLKNPFELVTDTQVTGVQTVYFARYLPYNEDSTVLVHKSGVIALSLCAERYSLMYDKKVAAFEALKEAVTDPDSTAIIESSGDDEESDDSDDHEDDYDPSEASPVRVPRTYH